MFNAYLLVNVQLIYDQMMLVLSAVKHLLHASLQIKLSIEWLVTTSCIFNCYAWEALFALRTPSVFDTTYDISTAQFNFDDMEKAKLVTIVIVFLSIQTLSDGKNCVI